MGKLKIEFPPEVVELIKEFEGKGKTKMKAYFDQVVKSLNLYFGKSKKWKRVPHTWYHTGERELMQAGIFTLRAKELYSEWCPVWQGGYYHSEISPLKYYEEWVEAFHKRTMEQAAEDELWIQIVRVNPVIFITK